MSFIENWDEIIPLWRTQYGIVKEDPDAAYVNWKHRSGNFGAPVGTLTALSHCLEEIERLRALLRDSGEGDRRASSEYILMSEGKLKALDTRLRREAEKQGENYCSVHMCRYPGREFPCLSCAAALPDIRKQCPDCAGLVIDRGNNRYCISCGKEYGPRGK